MEKIYLGDAGPKVSPVIYGFYRWSKEDSIENMERLFAFVLILALIPLTMRIFMGTTNAKNCLVSLLKTNP